MTDEPSGGWSSVRVEHTQHGLWSAAAHEFAMVATTGVVAVDPALELAVELGETVEALAVEGGAVELLQGRALEAFARGVLPGRAIRRAQLLDADGCRDPENRGSYLLSLSWRRYLGRRSKAVASRSC